MKNLKENIKPPVKIHQIVISVAFALMGLLWFTLTVKYKNIQTNSLKDKECAPLTGWYYLSENALQYIDLPLSDTSKLPVDERGFFTICYDIKAEDCEDFNIAYFTKHQITEVCLNGNKVYSFTGENFPKWLKVSGRYYHIVRFPKNEIKEGSTITISYKPTYKPTNSIFSDIFKGTTSSLKSDLFFRRFLKTIGSFAILLVSIVLLVFALIFKKQLGQDHTVRALGFMSLQVAVWLLSESCIVQYIFPNPIFIWTLDYLFFISLPLTALYFMEEQFRNYNDKGIGFFTYAYLLLCIIEILLQIFGVFSLPEMMPATLIFFLIIIVYLVIFLFKYFIRKGKKIGPEEIGTFCLLSGSSFELIHFFYNGYESTEVIVYAFLIFFIFLGIKTYRVALKRIKDFADIDTIHRLAFIDFATSLYNKTAFYNFVEKFSGRNEDYCLILFDMNSLKQINDNYGHIYGDRVIKCFSECSQNAFGRYGKIYRVGGDEFLALIHNPNIYSIKNAFIQFDDNVLNQKTVQYKFTVAYGACYFTASSPKDFFTAQNKADEKMYRMKAEMKKNIQPVQDIHDFE